MRRKAKPPPSPAAPTANHWRSAGAGRPAATATTSIKSCAAAKSETGTLYTYDAAGNLSASAAGLPSGTAGSANTRTVSRSFDARNRLQTLSFPDDNDSQSWAYTADGLPSTVTTANSGTTVTNTYAYNKRRLLTSESMAPDAAQSWSIGYTYDALGQRVLETRPGSVTVAYAVNALGQTTQITARTDTEPSPVTVASNAFYANGALKQFTYGNGIVHTMTQNARQLPSRSTDGSVLVSYQLRCQQQRQRRHRLHRKRTANQSHGLRRPGPNRKRHLADVWHRHLPLRHPGQPHPSQPQRRQPARAAGTTATAL